jgi:hypothetical protein
MPCETLTYEMTGLAMAAVVVDSPLMMSSARTGATPISYEQNPASAVLQERLIEHVRILYRHNDLSGVCYSAKCNRWPYPLKATTRLHSCLAS